jgi:hypothetical protein
LQLTYLPTSISEEITLPITGSIIWRHDNDWILNTASSYDEETYNAVCQKVLRSVLLPSITDDVRRILSGFTQKLIIQTLHCIHNLTYFNLNI